MPDDDKNVGNVMPTPAAGEPLPGQPEPGTPSPVPQGGKEEDKTVPLAALHEERTKRQELQAELEALKQIAGNDILFDMNGRPVPRQQAHVTPQAGNRNQVDEELEELWQTDPRQAVRTEIMAAMTYRDHLESQVDSQILKASQDHPDFAEYDGTIRNYIRSLPLSERSKPGVVDIAYYVVKGQNAGTAIERAKAEVLRKIQAGEQVQGLQPGMAPAAPTPKPNALNEEQLKVASAMGLTPEQYASAMQNRP